LPREPKIKCNLIISIRNTSLASPIRSVTSPPSSVGSVCPGEFDVGCLGSSSGKSPVQTTTANILPPPETLLAVADVYFKYCHNQPYGLFHEETFRYKLAAGTLPKHLIFAFLASALRFSSDPCYRDNRFEAIERYASESSKSILLPWNGVENAVDISTVQAILLLSVIDYTSESRTEALLWLLHTDMVCYRRKMPECLD
jgi:hypothetical protein